jgi:hypothetical protein
MLLMLLQLLHCLIQLLLCLAELLLVPLQFLVEVPLAIIIGLPRGLSTQAACSTIELTGQLVSVCTCK